MNIQNVRLLNSKEVCKIFKCARSTLTELTQSGKLRYIQLTDSCRSMRFNEQDILNYLEERTKG